MVFKCIGHHGTTHKASDEILRTGIFLCKESYENDWLGKGIYFFENDILQAEDFCFRARKLPKYSILQCNIKCKSDKLLDFCRVDNYNLFNKVADEIRNKVIKTEQGKDITLINAAVITYMCYIIPMDVIRAAFPVPGRKRREKSDIIPIQIQICVRNHVCISDIEEVLRK